ncbi:hypothetical protein FPZ24_16085 [Sphingomonas panacisoli]|uniref:DUF2306 domain-containing protein n=1 Tax=Sphingomonas panacisoli TaxID=1813879 RepID=A0A5B8LLH5_9SPHN|nr:hypothetical protein [Sphingomonas panacisoli]QDZ08799.1 hypothetical protein FPZ24_16085 [Sphingomonas panacisoli]
MASIFFKPKPVRSIAPDWYEKMLAGVAAVLLVIVIIALAKGHADWAQVPRGVWLHLATIMVALMLTPYMLLRPRGTPIHRLLGKVWVVAMTATAAISLFVRYSNPGHFSFIHILSVFVLIMAPRVWLTARSHNLAGHRGTVRGLVTGALIVAGYFTLLETRLLGHWLFG